MMKNSLLLILSLLTLAATAEMTVKNGGYSLTFDRQGAIRQVTSGSDALALKGSGTLWRAVFADGSELKAAELPPPAIGNNVLKWTSPQLDVTIQAVASDANCIDLVARVRAKTKNIEEFYLPDRLEFAPEALEGFHVNLPLPRNPGMRLNRYFFEDCATLPDRPWQVEKRGNTAYQTLLERAPAPYAKVQGPPEPAPAGKALYDAAFLEQLVREEMILDRPFSGFNVNADLVLLRLGEGNLFAGSRLGQKNGGALFRLGGHFADRKRNGALIRSLVTTTAAGLVREQPQKYSAALIAPSGIPICTETASRIEEWQAALEKQGFSVRLLTDGEAVYDALKNARNEIIVNPYGSIVLLPESYTDADFAAAMKAFVGRGNYWFECAGYSFFNRFVPVHFLTSGRQTAPAMLADFVHLDFTRHSLALYSVQPIDYEPFDRAHGYQPAIIEFGGSPSGGFFRHGYLFTVPAGSERQTPPWRIRFGGSAFDTLRSFCADHGLTRTLDQKLSPELLEKMRNSIICKLAPRHIRDVMNLTEILPSPLIYHTSRYLNGGPLDKGYPDHLPVRAEWASPEEFATFLARIRAAGSLFMPYVNNTWWCDNPRGPTFTRIGEAPLFRQKDGSLRREDYGSGKTGFTVSSWHPEARKAADKITDGFSSEYDADIIFQDQVGARGARLDFNPAVPFPELYNEGIASQARIDARRKPLATEDLWWGVIDSEVMACGMHFGLTPPRRGDHRKFLKELYPKSTWTIFPMLQVMASDKLMLTPHNLGYHSGDDLGTSWPIALGFSLVMHCNGTPSPAELERIRWVDRLQKSVCSRYVGKAIQQFRHDWGTGQDEYDNGVIEARYGDVNVFANVSLLPRKHGEIAVPPGGFVATAPGMSAGITGHGRFVIDGGKLYCYGKPGSSVEIPGVLRIRGAECTAANGFTQFQLPAGTEKYSKFYTFELEP